MISQLEKHLAELPNLSDDHLSDWHTVVAEQTKVPNSLELRSAGVTMEEALEAQAWAKSFIGNLEAEIIRRWKNSVELSR